MASGCDSRVYHAGRTEHTAKRPGRCNVRRTVRLSFCLLPAVLLLFAVSPTTRAETHEEEPTDDVSVQVNHGSTTGVGGSYGLPVGYQIIEAQDPNEWAAFIKFDLQPYANGTINSAYLYLTAYDYSGSGHEIGAYRVAEHAGKDWYEDSSTLTWNSFNQDADIGTQPMATVLVNSIDTPDIFNWNVTTIAQEFNGGDFTVCMKKYPSNLGDWVGFHSRNVPDGQSAYRPYLKIGYTPPADEATEVYDWEDCGTILGMYPTDGVIATNVDWGLNPVHDGMRSLRLEDNAASGTPQAYLAWITGCRSGDVIEASFWRYDVTPIAAPSCRIWAHYSLGGDITDYRGSAGGQSDYGPGTGWDLATCTWTFETPDATYGDRDGMVIECRTYSNPGDVVWIDYLTIRVSPYHGQHLILPYPGPSSSEATTWGAIKAIYR
jgi:hypothetical protein